MARPANRRSGTACGRKRALMLAPFYDGSRTSTEGDMDRNRPGRRDFIAMMAIAGVAAARRGAASTEYDRPAAYDPSAIFELSVSEVELRRNAARRMLMARVY